MAKAKLRLVSQITEEEYLRAKAKREEIEERERQEWEREKKENKKRLKELKLSTRVYQEQQRQKEYLRIQREERAQQRYNNEQYKARQEKRAGRPIPDACEICGEAKPLVFDHCHAKGHFRGWICNACNSGLGMARDSVELLRKMAEYLERDRAGWEASP